MASSVLAPKTANKAIVLSRSNAGSGSSKLPRRRDKEIIPDSDLRGDKPIVMEIPFEPVAKAAVRRRVVNGQVMAFTPQKTAEALEWLRGWFAQYKSLAFGSYVPVKVSVEFYRLNNRTAKRGLARREDKPVRKPDLDNFEKLLNDAMNGILLADDAQITSCVKKKRWSDKDYGYIKVKLEVDNDC